jgi:hypothetical protein
MKNNLIIFLFLQIGLVASGWSQELYPFTEPASNMPANSITAKYSLKLLNGFHTNKIEQRHSPELMVGISKKWMLHLGTSFSDMYFTKLRWESVRLYSQYRFYSNDDIHKHFRMAAFGRASYSKNDAYYDELSLEGDQSGIQVGVTATQLVNKLAISASISNVQVLQETRKNRVQFYPYQAMDFSLSGGYLLFPRTYTSYKQTNLNLYVEVLGQKTYDLQRHYIDIAPALQLIFNSNSKLNLGYRFEVSGNMHRMAMRSWMFSFERSFLNAIGKK